MKVSLVMFREEGQPKEFPIEPGQTTIGRREECELRIPLAEVSRKHAVLIVEGADAGSVTLRDLGSANGTYINNKRITEQELSPGDHIVIGPVVFTVRINGEPADVRPVHTRLEARTAAKVSASKRQAKKGAAEDKFSIGVTDEEEDPISALEALAASDDTAALDMDDSFSSPADSQT